MGENADHVIFCFSRDLERLDAVLGRRLNFRTLADVADVALDHFLRADEVDITNKLDRHDFAALRAQRMVLVADVFLLLELGEGRFIRVDIVEQTDLPKLKTDDALERIVEQIEQERIRVDDFAGVCVENQDPILRGLE